jgi:choline-glycine betaine transporter
MMKYAQSHPRALYTGIFIFAIIGFILIEFATSAIINALYIHWLMLAMALVMCVLPHGRQRLVASPKETPRYTLKPWIFKILWLQLSVFAIYLGMDLVFQHWLPLHPSNLMQPPLQLLLRGDGLFPWGLYALFAARMGYLSYINNKDAVSSELVKPILKLRQGSILEMSLNHQSRLATTIAVSTTFAMITLLLVSLLLPRSLPLHPGFQLKTMVIVTMVILLGFMPASKKLIKYLLKPKIPLFIGLLTSLVLLAIFIWLLNALFVHTGQAPIKTPRLILWLERKNTADLWQIFSAAWWIAWTPVLSAHFARLSRGRSIRSMILVMLTLPTLLTLLMTLAPKSQTITGHYPMSFSLLALGGFLYLLKQITEKSHLPILIRSFLPKRDHYKRRDHYFYCGRLWKTTLLMVYLYLPAGISVSTIAIFMLSLVFMLQTVIILIASMIRCCRYD